MKKLKFFLSLLMLFTFSLGTMWATDVAVTTNPTTSGTFTVTADKAGGSNAPIEATNCLRLYANNTLTIETSGSDNITALTISWTKNGSKTFADVTADVGSYTHPTAAGDGTWSGKAKTIVFTVGSTGQIQITNVSITTSSGGSTDPTINVNPTALNFGKAWEDTETTDYGYSVIKTLHVTGEYLTDDVKLEITNSGSGTFDIWDPRWASPTVSEYTITPTAGAIDTNIVISAYTKKTGTYAGTLNVSSLATSADFTPFDVDLSITLVSLPDPVDGAVVDEIIVSDLGVTSTSYTACTDKQASNTGHSSAVYAGTVARNGNETQYNIQLNSGQTNGKVREIASTTSGGTLKRVLVYWATQSANTADRKFMVYGSNDAYTGSETEATGTKIGDLTYASGDLFAYLDVTESYKFVQIVASAAVYADMIEISWMPSEIADPVISGTTPFYPTTTVTLSCATDGAEIHYTTDGSDPTGGDNTYSAPFTIDATKTVKAIAIKGVNVSEIVSKTFTKGTPISVTDAIALIPSAGNTENDQFVVGYVCTAGESVSSGQMTYYISDDGTTDDTETATTDRLQVYKGKNLNNTDFSAASDLVVGDKVVVYGQLKNFSGIYEFNSGNYIVEKVAKGDVASVAISGTATHGAYEGGDAFDPAGLTVTATYASGFQEDVTASATWSPATITTQSGNTDVTASFGGKTSAAKTVNISLNKYTVTFNTSVYGGTWGIQKAGEPISSGNYFPKGTVLTVVTSPVAGYTLGSITVNDEPLVGNEITIGTENITVAVEFTMVQEGVLVLSAKSLDWGTITVGTSPLSVPSKTFTLAGSNLTEGRTVTLTTPDWCHLTQTTANPTAGGNIATTNFYVYVNDATLNAAGEYSGNIVISSDDLTADSLIAVSLNVVEATPSISVKDVYAQDITSIDFSNVDKGASVSQFNISLVGHNLTGDVKVTVANATSTNVFVTNGFRPSNTYSPSGGEIDAAVYVIPYTSTGGEFNGTITFHSESGDFDDIVIPLHINIKPDAGLTWSASSATAYTKAKPYTLPTLTNPHDVTVAYSGNNDEVATVNASTGEVTLVAAGEVTITASFAGNGDYVAQEVEYTLTVKAPTGLRLSGEMTTKEYEEGDHVSVEGYAVETVFGSVYDYYDVTSEATWKLDGVDIATKTVTATAEYTIEATWQGFTAWEYVNLVRKTHAVNFNNPEHGNLTVKVGDDTFLSGAKFKKGTVVTITISPASGYEGSVTVNGEPLVGNSYTIGTEDINIVATFNKVPVAAGLEWSAASADVRYGSSNTYPTLSNPNSVDVTYESTDESIATIAADGSITLKANGSTTIKAIFAGNEDYLAATVSYTLNVSAGIVTTTPSPLALDLGDVLYQDELTQYKQTFHLHIENLKLGEYNQVRIDFEGSDFYAFGIDGDVFVTGYNYDGIIDKDIAIIPSSFGMSYSFAQVGGQRTASIKVTQTGAVQMPSVIVGTVTMNIVEAYAITATAENGTLTFNGNAAPKVAAPGSTFTLAATPESGYKANGITVQKVSDESDVTADVLAGNVLTMPSYAIKVVAAFVEDTGTALDDLESGEKVVKVLDNGVVYIIRDGARYNLLGEKVK